jgi:hypothetical protein
MDEPAQGFAGSAAGLDCSPSRGGVSGWKEPGAPVHARDVSVRPSDNNLVPLTVFDCKGIPATRRERIETAVTAGGKHVPGPHEAWIAGDVFRGGVRVIITGPQGFERHVEFTMNEDPAELSRGVRETMEAEA